LFKTDQISQHKIVFKTKFWLFFQSHKMASDYMVVDWIK